MIITAEYLKSICPIHQNVENSKLDPAIMLAQETAIIDVLGTALYNDVIANPSATNNVALLVYLKPALAWTAFCESFYELHYKFSQKGIVKHTGTNEESVDHATLKSIQQEYKGKADFYLQRLTNYLIANASTTFPLYLSPGNSFDTVHPSTDSNVSGGLFLDE